MVYVCLLPLNQFIVTVEKLQYSRLSHYVSFIKITGITALCMSLNLIIVSSYDLINYSLNLKEKKSKKHLISLQSSLNHVCYTCWWCYILLTTLVHSVTLTLLRQYRFSS